MDTYFIFGSILFENEKKSFTKNPPPKFPPKKGGNAGKAAEINDII